MPAHARSHRQSPKFPADATAHVRRGTPRPLRTGPWLPHAPLAKGGQWPLPVVLGHHASAPADLAARPAAAEGAACRRLVLAPGPATGESPRCWITALVLLPPLLLLLLLLRCGDAPRQHRQRLRRGLPLLLRLLRRRRRRPQSVAVRTAIAARAGAGNQELVTRAVGQELAVRIRGLGEPQLLAAG